MPGGFLCCAFGCIQREVMSSLKTPTINRYRLLCPRPPKGEFFEPYAALSVPKNLTKVFPLLSLSDEGDAKILLLPKVLFIKNRRTLIKLTIKI